MYYQCAQPNCNNLFTCNQPQTHADIDNNQQVPPNAQITNISPPTAQIQTSETVCQLCGLVLESEELVYEPQNPHDSVGGSGNYGEEQNPNEN